MRLSKRLLSRLCGIPVLALALGNTVSAIPLSAADGPRFDDFRRSRANVDGPQGPALRLPISPGDFSRRLHLAV